MNKRADNVKDKLWNTNMKKYQRACHIRQRQDDRRRIKRGREGNQGTANKEAKDRTVPGGCQGITRFGIENRE